MRRGFLLPKAGAPPNSSPLALSQPKTESSHLPTGPPKSYGTPAIASTHSAPSTASSTVKIPTEMFHAPEAPPAVPPPGFKAGPLRYVEYPRDHTGPPHLVTGAVLHLGMEEEFESAYPGFVRPFTIPSPPVYEVVPIKGAGLGVIATSDIARGQTIMRERPLLFLPVIYPVASMGENLAFYEFVVNSMRPVNREAVYALVNARGPEWYSHLKGILDTNAFGTHTAVPGYGAQYAALGRDISRINHSCAPNALWIWDLETLTFTVAAITPIRAGEQVTIAYIDIACPRFQRQELLTSRYKFTCKCPACDPDDMSQLMNDMQREIINLFAENEQPARDAEAFERWLADGARDSYYDPHDTLKPATFARDVERLDGFTRARFAFGCMFTLRFVQANIWEPTLARIVKGYSVRENEERVREYALLAAGLKKAHTGSDGGWMAVAMKPRSTDWWGKLGAAR